MKSERDNGWEELGRLWRQAGDAAPSARSLRLALRRRQWLLAGIVAGEVAVTGLLVAATLWRVRLGLDAFWWTWLVLVWASWATAAVFAVRNRRGVWRPAERSTRACLELFLERARRQGRTARFVLALVAGEGLAVAGLFLWGGVRGGTRQGAWGLLAALCTLYAVWALWFGRRAAREERRLRGLLAAWDASGSPEEPPSADL